VFPKRRVSTDPRTTLKVEDCEMSRANADLFVRISNPGNGDTVSKDSFPASGTASPAGAQLRGTITQGGTFVQEQPGTVGANMAWSLTFTNLPAGTLTLKVALVTTPTQGEVFDSVDITAA
jgi:hypothetical protein